MHSSNTSLDSWLGKLVWFFPRDSKGLPTGNSAVCGIVIDRVANGIYIIMHNDERIHAWVSDMEEVEDWDEEVERENGSVEES